MLPADFKAREDGRVVLISIDKYAMIVASDRRVAEEISSLLHQTTVNRKLRALDEWEKLVRASGLAGPTSKKIDRAVERGEAKSNL